MLMVLCAMSHDTRRVFEITICKGGTEGPERHTSKSDCHLSGVDEPITTRCFHACCGGSSSVLFAYSFLLLFGQIDNIYKVEQDSLYFFLKGDSRAFISEKEILPFRMWFQR